MAIENIGWGAGGGFIGGTIIAILTAFGLEKRVCKLEIGKLDENVFNQFQRDLITRLNRMEDKLDKIWKNGNGKSN